jgi:hypothetical protein
MNPRKVAGRTDSVHDGVRAAKFGLRGLPLPEDMAKNDRSTFGAARVGFLNVNLSPSHLCIPYAVSAAGFMGATLLTGCSPTISLATPEPLKADIAVRLDVYQKTAPTKAKDEQSSIETASLAKTAMVTWPCAAIRTIPSTWPMPRAW